jgi:hypothetical protein
MKQTIFVLLLAIGSSTYSLACDVCGCASSAFTVGMMPNSKYHLLGIRSSFRWFESQPSPDGHGYRENSKQFFTSTDILGRFKVGKKFQIQGYVPYVHNTKLDSIKTSIHGLGDIVLLGNYVFVDNMDSLSRKVRHSGTFGLGLKLPTGKFFKLGFDEVNMLPGSGSFDFLANINYAVQFKKIGLQNETSFIYKTENKYKFRFGNAVSISQVLFYQWKINENLFILPQIGLNYNQNWKDRKNGIYTEDSFNGGTIYNAIANLYITRKNLSVNTQFYFPLAQRLNESLVTQHAMFRIGINYFIKSNI